MLIKAVLVLLPVQNFVLMAKFRCLALCLKRGKLITWDDNMECEEVVNLRARSNRVSHAYDLRTRDFALCTISDLNFNAGIVA